MFWCEREIYCNLWNFLGLSLPVESDQDLKLRLDFAGNWRVLAVERECDWKNSLQFGSYNESICFKFACSCFAQGEVILKDTVEILASSSQEKNNGFPILDILGYLKNTHKNPKFGRVPKFGIFVRIL